MSADQLNAREREYCRCLIQHGHNKKTAALMGVTDSTARWYLRAIKMKLGVQTLVQVALIWDRFERSQLQENSHANPNARRDGSHRPAAELRTQTQADAADSV